MSTLEASTAWDRHADTYATLFAPLTGFVARGMLAMVESRVPEGATILDIACGSGALAIPAIERAHRRQKPGRVVAADFSPTMVELTRRAARATGAPDTLYACDVQDGERLTYGDASFDAVFSCFGIFLFADRKAGWREAARVLRPGGTFVTSVWQGPETNPMLRAQMMPLMRALPPRLLASPPPGPSGPWIEIATAEGLVAEIAGAAPFVDVRVFPFRATFAVPDRDRAFRAMQDNPVMGALLKQCDDAELAAVRRAVMESFAEVAGADTGPLLLESACNILVATRR